MMAGYLAQGKAGDTATFDLYYRRNPFNGGYAVAAGLEPAVRAALNMEFSTGDIEYLRSLQTPAGTLLFPEAFLEILATFRFHGDIRAIEEGTVVFANEPLLQVSGRLSECQILESVLLCIVNFQTLVATKAARLWEASRHGTILEFGLRRAQGPDGALGACRAAYIGGAAATSNVLGAATYGLPPKGAHAHSCGPVLSDRTGGVSSLRAVLSEGVRAACRYLTMCAAVCRMPSRWPGNLKPEAVASPEYASTAEIWHFSAGVPG